MKKQFIILFILPAWLHGAEIAPRERALRDGARFLWSQQDAGGGWHSKTYGLLKSGQSLTPFILNTLLRVPESAAAKPAEKIDAAFRFINSRLRGDLAHPGESDRLALDYPNYATALALSALLKAQKPAETYAPLARYLLDQQFTETHGWKPENPAYGAWGMGGPVRRPPETGHVDLSMTRFVLEALAQLPADCAERAQVRQALQKASVYLKRCQNVSGDGGDGGFFFSTVIPEANKAGTLPGGFRSYGSATADGILALLACRGDQNEPRVQSALRWLVSKHAAAKIPGFPDAPHKEWDRGLRFYYAAAAARVFAQAQSDAGASRHLQELADLIAGQQRADGSWINASFLVKEDDPLIATTLAVQVLIEAGK